MIALVCLTAFTLAACGGSDDEPASAPEPQEPVSQAATAELALRSTADLHANIRSHDYFKLAEDRSIGFGRTAMLIRQTRGEFVNSLLVDNGDTIQGTRPWPTTRRWSSRSIAASNWPSFRPCRC